MQGLWLVDRTGSKVDRERSKVDRTRNKVDPVSRIITRWGVHSGLSHTPRSANKGHVTLMMEPIDSKTTTALTGGRSYILSNTIYPKSRYRHYSLSLLPIISFKIWLIPTVFSTARTKEIPLPGLLIPASFSMVSTT